MTNPQNSPYAKARGEVQTIIAALPPHLQSMLRQEIMIENQHKKIKGYRDLTEVEIGAMNDCKSVASDVGILCDKVAGMTGVDQRWVAIAKTDLQKGFMSLIRSIAKPETF